MMFDHLSAHPLDIDLVDFVEGNVDGELGQRIVVHLESCLPCRIKRQRLTGVPPVELADLGTLSVPYFDRLEVDDEGERTPDAGELWLTIGDDATMVLVRAVRAEGGGAVVVPVTFDVEVADSGTLVLDASASPLGVPLAIFERLIVSLPSGSLRGRVVTVRDVDLLAIGDTDPGVSRGAAIEGPTDPRLEVREFLVDRLAALDPPPTEDAADAGDIAVESRTPIDSLRDELMFHRGRTCRVTALGELPAPGGAPAGWSGVARIRELTVRILVIGTPNGLREPADFVAAQALFVRLDGSALVACSSGFEAVDLFDAPTLFGAFELPGGGRASAPLISGLSLPDTVLKFLDRVQSQLVLAAPSTAKATRVNVREVLAATVVATVDTVIARSSRFSEDKRDGTRQLEPLKEQLAAVLESALEGDFDPAAISSLADGDS